jgi:hypothetical protein
MILGSVAPFRGAENPGRTVATFPLAFFCGCASALSSHVSTNLVDTTAGIEETGPHAEKIEPRIMNMLNTPVRPGDRFLRAGNPTTMWIIDRFMELPNMPPHVRLFREDRPTQTRVIALSLLDDARQFRRLPGTPNQG